jgi:S-adenosylmethionine-dependent methyltransferase
MTVAKDRCRVYGVEVEFQILNAEGIARAFGPDTFDQIIFFACLEHMSVAERLTSLRAAWNILPNGGLLVVVETPNRLWYYDGHTSLLPFFHWLPDELAFSYSAFSPRESFRDLHRRRDASTGEQLLRRGRGVSFHEFDLAIRPAKDLKVLSSLSTFEGIRGRLRTPRLDRRYSSLLRSAYPGIHEGFFDESLYLIIEKQ